MMKLIWMSDLHFAEKGTVLGHDPRKRLQIAIDHINTRHADASMCVITGDMVNRGSEADYLGLRAALDTLLIPYLSMVGNHDNRALFKQALRLPETCMEGFIQYTIETPEGLIVCLDTQKIGSDAGEFCDARRHWLAETLCRAGTTPVFLFLHHPPIALGLPMQDTENMRNGQEFINLVSGFECVKYLFMGHVHRPLTGTVGGISYATMRSILYQAPPPRPAWSWDTFRPSEEAPCIGVIQIKNSAVVLQFDQICPYENGVLLSAATSSLNAF